MDNQRQRRFNANRALKQRDGILRGIPKVLSRHLPGLTPEESLAEIERRSKVTAAPDGYKSQTRCGEVSSAPVKHDQDCPESLMTGDCACDAGFREGLSRPTENTALRIIDGGKRSDDPQMEAFRRIDSAFQACWDAVADIDAAWDLICHITDMRRGRETTLGSCQACLRDDVPNQGDDRIKSAYCPPCYKAWQRTDEGNGRQDRASFERSRRELVVVDAS